MRHYTSTVREERLT